VVDVEVVGAGPELGWVPEAYAARGATRETLEAMTTAATARLRNFLIRTPLSQVWL
jgi:hypothetical protein